MSRELRYVLERVTGPDIEPVTLAEAKRHIRQFVTVTTEDADVEALIEVAREWVEDYTARVMIEQTWQLSVSRLLPLYGDSVSGYVRPGYYVGLTDWMKTGGIYLMRSPVLEVTALYTVDSAGAETLVAADQYQLRDQDSKWPRVVPLTGATWTGGEFRVVYRAGFADRLGSPVTGAEVVPAALKHAMKLIIANYDENRGPVAVGTISSALPLGIEWLLAGQKCNLGFT